MYVWQRDKKTGGIVLPQGTTWPVPVALIVLSVELVEYLRKLLSGALNRFFCGHKVLYLGSRSLNMPVLKLKPSTLNPINPKPHKPYSLNPEPYKP